MCHGLEVYLESAVYAKMVVKRSLTGFPASYFPETSGSTTELSGRRISIRCSPAPDFSGEKGSVGFPLTSLGSYVPPRAAGKRQ